MSSASQFECTNYCGKSTTHQHEYAPTDVPVLELRPASMLEGDFVKIASHVGHGVVVAIYGENANAAVECEDCCEVLIDIDSEDPEFKTVARHFGHHIEARRSGSQSLVVCNTCGEAFVLATQTVS